MRLGVATSSERSSAALSLTGQENNMSVREHVMHQASEMEALTRSDTMCVRFQFSVDTLTRLEAADSLKRVVEHHLHYAGLRTNVRIVDPREPLLRWELEVSMPMFSMIARLMDGPREVEPVLDIHMSVGLLLDGWLASVGGARLVLNDRQQYERAGATGAGDPHG